MRLRPLFLSLFVCLSWLYCMPGKLYAQGFQTEFGKNVTQFKDFDWYYYQSENFDVYFYSGGKELARYVVTQGEKYLKEIQNRIDYSLDGRVTFIVYNSYTDYRQSNYRVGEAETNTGGRTRIQNNKAFIYFDGSHVNFSIQIRGGITQVILNDILYGGSLQERVQNNVLLNIPAWYSQGLVSYMGRDWSAEQEDALKRGILSGRFRKFKKISDQDATLIGHSLWKYINDQYGEASVANILYIMRANKSVESGYLFVLGKSFVELYQEWYQFEQRHFTSEKGQPPQGAPQDMLKRVFKKGTVTRWAISSKGDYAAVVTNHLGKEKVWVVNMLNGHKKAVYSSGYRRNASYYDYNYPVIAWNKKQNILTIIFEHHSTPYFMHYNVDEKKMEPKQIITRIDRVLSLDYSDNGRTAVMSVVQKGQTDIVTFDFKSMQMRFLTEDIYDDLDPKFVRGKGVVFSSNRKILSRSKDNTNTSYTFSDNFDIFYIPDYLIRSKGIKRLSDAESDETMPSAYDSSYFSYLTTDNGLINRNAVYLDSIFEHIRVIAYFSDTSIKTDTMYFYRNDVSAIHIPQEVISQPSLMQVDTQFIYRDTFYTYPLTDYSTNILSYEVNPKTRGLYELFNQDRKFILYKQAIPVNIPNKAVNRSRGTVIRRFSISDSAGTAPKIDRGINKEVIIITPTVPKDSSKQAADTTVSKPYFQTDYPQPKKTKMVIVNNEAKPNVTQPNPTDDDSTVNTALTDLFGSRNKKNKFGSASPYFLSITPDYVITQLDNTIIGSPYMPYKPGDNTLTSPVLNGMIKYGLSDLFKDYRLMAGFRVMSNLRGAEYFMKYDNLKKRLDKSLLYYRKGEIKDNEGLDFYRVTSNEMRGELKWPFSEVSAVRGSIFGRQDKITYLTGDIKGLTRPSEPTYWTGGKIDWTFDNSISTGMNLYNGTRAKVYTEFFDALNKKNTSFTVVGIEARHYQKISRQIIWANRFSAASSFGKAKVVYFLGGVNNWITPVFNQDNIVDPEQNYVYKAQAVNMHGFDQNVRNGSSYTVWNSELRIPVLKYIYNRPFRSQFFENLQVVGFADAGSAWTGFNPLSSSNSYNKRIIQETPFRVTVINQRDPFVYGYGFGFRSVILGYFLRVDYSWGVEDRVTTPRKVYIALGLDF